MIARSALIACMVCLAALIAGQTAGAHQSDPNYESTVRSIAPQPDGFSAQIVGGDDTIEMVNRSGEQLIAFGYEDEPYVRIDADGTVYVNMRSPAHFLNQDRYAKVEVPDSADPKAEPQWKRVDRSAKYDWHDHRVHWMGATTPSAVVDERQRTKILDWTVPYEIGDQAGAVKGDLYWRGTEEGAEPGGAAKWLVVAIPALFVVAGAVILLRRREREPKQKADAW